MPRNWTRIAIWTAAGVGALGIILLIAFLAIRVAPDALQQSDKLSDTQGALERGRIRTAILVFFGGLVAAAGAVFTGLSFRLAQRGQATDRFSKAIELIGEKETSVRLGGIYALGHVSRDDPRKHHAAAVQVLVAYIRERSPWPPAGQAATSLQVPPAGSDIKAAMEVLARRKAAYDPPDLTIDLSHTNLRGVEARGIDLRRALLIEAQLQEADLRDASLHGASLTKANADDAQFDGATLDGATTFERVSLLGASLKTTKGVYDADFNRAIHRPADPGATRWPYHPPDHVVVQP